MDILTVENVTLFLSGVVIPIVTVFIKNKLDKDKNNKEDKLAKELKVSGIINNKLELLKLELNADRIWITQYHNGGHYYPTNKSIQKFSIFYEVIDPTIESIKLTFQNIPVSLFTPSLNHVLENNVLTISDFKDPIIPTYGLKYTAEENNCKSMYMVGIRDINNKLIGCLGVEYVKRKKILENIDIQTIELEAAQIGGILSTHLYEK